MAGRIWIGLLLVLFGVGFLLQQAGIWHFWDVLGSWWPIILIFIGVIQLFYRIITGFIFIALGLLLFINEWVDVNLTVYIWPVLIIVVGLTFIFTRSSKTRSLHADRSIENFSLFSGSELVSQSQEFEGGSVTAIFGGAEIDLRDVSLSEKGAALDLTTVFGGISIIVPRDVHVEVTGVPIFGGWENKVKQPVEKNSNLPSLHIKCVTVFGGVEIYN